MERTESQQTTTGLLFAAVGKLIFYDHSTDC